MNTLQLKLSQEIWHSASFCPEIEHFMALNNIPSKQRFKILTCILEAIGNIVAHANSDSNNVIVILSCRDDRVTIDLLDNSPLVQMAPPES